MSPVRLAPRRWDVIDCRITLSVRPFPLVNGMSSYSARCEEPSHEGDTGRRHPGVDCALAEYSCATLHGYGQCRISMAVGTGSVGLMSVVARFAERCRAI